MHLWRTRVQFPGPNSQPSTTPVPEDPMPSSVLCGHASGAHACKQNSYTSKSIVRKSSWKTTHIRPSRSWHWLVSVATVPGAKKKALHRSPGGGSFLKSKWIGSGAPRDISTPLAQHSPPHEQSVHRSRRSKRGLPEWGWLLHQPLLSSQPPQLWTARLLLSSRLPPSEKSTHRFQGRKSESEKPVGIQWAKQHLRCRVANTGRSFTATTWMVLPMCLLICFVICP